ncbi:hypothetical protein Tco_0153333 [Tanacetum coccineum]
MSYLKFADTHNLVAFLEKPTESEGFKEIVDFLNANPIKYALTVNPTVYCSCIKQFWDTVKAKMVNGEVQLQALVDKKKVIITESTIRRDLQLEDVEATECPPTTTIFEELTRMGAKTIACNEFSSTMASAIICLATNQNFNFSKYIFDSMVKNVDIMVKLWMYPRFVQVKVQLIPANPTDPHHTPTITQPSTSQPQNKQLRRKQRKDTKVSQPSSPTEPMTDETENVQCVPTHSNDPLLSGEDSLKLNELMELCTNIQKKVLDLETTKTIQALEIDNLKRRVKKLEKKQRSRTHKLRRLYKFGLSAKVISSDDEASLGDLEDASKQGRKILDINADEEITLDSTHVNTDLDMFGVHDPHGDEVFVEIEELVVNAATTTTTTATKTIADENTEVPQPSGSTDNVPDENVPTTSNDPLLSGEDRLKLTELMDLCTNLQKKVLDLEKAKTAQDSEIASLKKKVKKLERRNKSRTPGLKRLRKVGSARRVESSDEASLGDQEDASKQGRKIADIDADAEVTLIDETQGRNDDNLMFDTGVLDEQEVEVEKVVSTAEVTTESATTTTVDELTLAQTLIEIKAAKPKVRGVMIQEPSEFTTTTTTTTPAASKPSQDKGKAKMIESEKPLKKKDQIMYDQEVALNLQAQLQAELEEEERLTRQKEEEANIALIESWDNTQAMMDADYQMA